MNILFKKHYTFIIIIIIFVLTSCTSIESDDNTGLEAWVGEYSFNETYSEPDFSPMFMDYKINVFEEQDSYYATIEIMGQTTMAAAKAKLYGNDEWVSMTFVAYLPTHMIGLNSEPNDILISFRKEEKNIYTYWGAIEPMLYENGTSGEIYFLQTK